MSKTNNDFITIKQISQAGDKTLKIVWCDDTITLVDVTKLIFLKNKLLKDNLTTNQDNKTACQLSHSNILTKNNLDKIKPKQIKSMGSIIIVNFCNDNSNTNYIYSYNTLINHFGKF